MLVEYARAAPAGVDTLMAVGSDAKETLTEKFTQYLPREPISRAAVLGAIGGGIFSILFKKTAKFLLVGALVAGASLIKDSLEEK